MSRKPGATLRGSRLKGSKPRTDRTRRLRLAGSAEPNEDRRKPGKLGIASGGRLHPPPEEELGGGDICSLEERPSTEDNMPLVVHVAPEPAKGVEFEHYHPKRALAGAAIALTIAIFGTLSLLIVDHGLWSRPYFVSARARAATEAAAQADGAFVTPTRKPSLYTRPVQ
jgi:hypothetical protein